MTQRRAPALAATTCSGVPPASAVFTTAGISAGGRRASPNWFRHRFTFINTVAEPDAIAVTWLTVIFSGGFSPT